MSAVQAVSDFLSTNLIINLIGIVSAASAYILYRKKKLDEIKTATKLLLQEIRQAEQQIKTAWKLNTGFQFHQRLTPEDSWGKNKHLFIGLLEDNQFDDISTFFERTKRIDQLIVLIQEQRYAAPLLDVNKKKQKTSKSTPPESNSPLFQNAQPVQGNLMRMPFENPNLPGELNHLLGQLVIELIYNSNIGTRLKEISKMRLFSIRRFIERANI